MRRGESQSIFVANCRIGYKLRIKQMTAKPKPRAITAKAAAAFSMFKPGRL